MRCENCGERDAEVQWTQIVEGQMSTVHLCQVCAAEKGLAGPEKPGPEPLAGFLAQLGEPGHPGTAPGAAEPCPYCGTSLAAFRKTGRLGCSQCYPHFEPQLRGLLRRLHGSTQHVGKLYVADSTDADEAYAHLAGLKRRLQSAIEAERFEQAAELRDQIHELETAE